MAYTLGQAAIAVKKSKSTISKAIKNGTISAERQSNGSFKIEASELHRVFAANGEKEQDRTPERTRKDSVDTLVKMARIEARLEAAEQRSEDLEKDRDIWRQQATALQEDHRSRGFFKRLLGR
jgi:hypothetical protein